MQRSATRQEYRSIARGDHNRVGKPPFHSVGDAKHRLLLTVSGVICADCRSARSVLYAMPYDAFGIVSLGVPAVRLVSSITLGAFGFLLDQPPGRLARLREVWWAGRSTA